MKTYKRTKVLLTVFTITAVLVGIIMMFIGNKSTIAEPTSYPLTCRGGGTLVIANDGDNGVRIDFESAAGAVFEGLEPGQCSWSDRRFRPGEPTTICDSDTERASKYVGALVRSDRRAIFEVYNDGKGCLKVTGLRNF